ncbi:MAG: DUF814 domain-containing protein [Candidatus Protochlamydia sp.]|nr:DUF814 domain-containing protein [Candidatus Protochlamydia sp.]
MNIPHFSASQISLLVSELSQELSHSTFTSCSAVTLSKFNFHFLKQGNHKAISFCFTQPVRFHLSLNNRQIRSFFHPLHKKLFGMTLQSIEQINHDKIVKFSFCDQKKSVYFITEFFSKHPNFYILDSLSRILYSLFPSKQAIYEPAIRFHKEGDTENLFSNSTEIEHFYEKWDEKVYFEQEKRSLIVYFEKILKKLKNSKDKLIKNLEECSAWEKVKHDGDLLKAAYSQLRKGMTEIKLWDWLNETEKRFALDPKLHPQELIAKEYRRAKKLQAGLVPLNHQVELINAKILKCISNLEALESIVRLEDLLPLKPALRKQASNAAQGKKSLPYHEYWSAAGMVIWAGKNAQSNDKLTFSLANGNDWWLHINGVSGSHIVIKTKGKEPDNETLEDALQLALFHSKAKAAKEGEVCVTQKKFVSRLGGSQPGKVQISKHKTMRVHTDDQRLQTIKKRNISLTQKEQMNKQSF